MQRKLALYIFALLFIVAVQFMASGSMITGQTPRIEQTTLDGQQSMTILGQGPALLYFWAEWCGVCRGMQNNISEVLKDYPGLTVAERSGDAERIASYLSKNKLNWPVISDHNGNIGQVYGVQSVPALFFINSRGNIAFTSVGYTSEWGLRFRLWLTKFL
ncbi:protein disulfide oxidoreductase [Methylomonas sp. MgM2]